MKKIFFSLLFILSISGTKAQINPNSSYDDLITYFINAGTSNFDELYDGIIPLNNKHEPQRNYVNVLTGIMDSSYSYLLSYYDYNSKTTFSEFRISYCEKSNYQKQVKTDKIRKEVTNYFEELCKSPEYKIIKGNTFLSYVKNMYIYRNNILIASYHDKRKSVDGYEPNNEGNFCLAFYEQPRTKVLADETTYNGVFPTDIKKTTEPQVWEMKKIENSKESTAHYNGIFASNGDLKEGIKKYSGYGVYLDGSWYSENWESGVVKFVPEGTNDVVCGFFKNKKFDVNDFELTDYFTEKFLSTKISDFPSKYISKYNTNYACNWVKNIYTPLKNQVDAANKIKLDKWNREVEISNAKYHRDHPEVSARSNQVATMPCPACNSTGKVIDHVVTGSQYETTHYKTCTRCGGSGQCVR